MINDRFMEQFQTLEEGEERIFENLTNFCYFLLFLREDLNLWDEGFLQWLELLVFLVEEGLHERESQSVGFLLKIMATDNTFGYLFTHAY